MLNTILNGRNRLDVEIVEAYNASPLASSG